MRGGGRVGLDTFLWCGVVWCGAVWCAMCHGVCAALWQDSGNGAASRQAQHSNPSQHSGTAAHAQLSAPSPTRATTHLCEDCALYAVPVRQQPVKRAAYRHPLALVAGAGQRVELRVHPEAVEHVGVRGVVGHGAQRDVLHTHAGGGGGAVGEVLEAEPEAVRLGACKGCGREQVGRLGWGGWSGCLWAAQLIVFRGAEAMPR
jgi:hypothetical protein